MLQRIWPSSAFDSPIIYALWEDKSEKFWDSLELNKTSLREHSVLHFNAWVLYIASVHERKMPFECNVCDACFTAKTSFKSHIVSIHEKSLNCIICHSTFAEKSNFNKHDGKKSFKCNVCDASFTSNPSLKKHMLSSHEKRKPYNCNICDLTKQLE